RVLCLFDVDGTLTPARQKIEPEVDAFLRELRERVHIGVVGGSDYAKIAEQLGEGDEGETRRTRSRGGHLCPKSNAKAALAVAGPAILLESCFSSPCPSNLVSLPTHRGTFIEFRNGMLNISPIGRSCTPEERIEFSELDKKERIREKFVAALQREFAGKGLRFSRG
ncbi:PMM1 Phosphomannomutase, partial [Mystacornis crossleyi]|nr:PMM1 Phosphomannomutase [Mystacornis crossleyi]